MLLVFGDAACVMELSRSCGGLLSTLTLLVRDWFSAFSCNLGASVDEDSLSDVSFFDVFRRLFCYVIVLPALLPRPIPGDVILLSCWG